MKITSKTTPEEVKERMIETLQTMCGVENNEDKFSNHIQSVSQQMILDNYIIRLYNTYLDYYKKTGYHPHPANLLALKLLLKRNEFKGLKVSEGEFYNEYEESIDQSIQEVEGDFNITKEEIKSYIERKGLISKEDMYYHDKIWFVYAEGFGVLHGNLMYTPKRSSLDIYDDIDNKNIVFSPYEENEEKPNYSIYQDEYRSTRLKTNRVNYKKLIKSMILK